MNNINELCTIFNECFPELMISGSVFEKKISGCTVITEDHNGKTAAFAVVFQNAVVLLCVRPEYQRNGYGKTLLFKCEEKIKNSGYDHVVLGRSEKCFFFGAVIDTLSHRFFEKFGYTAENGCLSMILELDNFSYELMKKEFMPLYDAVFRKCTDDDMEEVRKAVLSVEPRWESRYSDSENAFGAFLDGKPVAFIKADPDALTIVSSDERKAGLLSYLGVIPSHRNRRIGSGLLCFAVNELKKNKCLDAFIDYTSLEAWYVRFGFEDCLWYWLGEKNI